MTPVNTYTTRTARRLLVVLIVLWVIAAYSVMAQDVLPNKVYRVTAFKRGETSVTSTSNHAEVVPETKIYIPNAFTPNGDGINDRFGVKGEGIAGFFIRIDMENSPYTDITLDIFETLWQQGYHHMGVVLQADLLRTAEDARRIASLGARIRLVKGAYAEPGHIAYPKKSDVDRAFVRLAELLLRDATYPAIATHDSKMIAATRQIAERLGVTPDRFEFQMLFGIRRDLQAALVREGYRVRIYVPFGRQWFPYFMRRLGERPENVTFVVGALLHEKRQARRAS